jgi:hypothetical protein
MELPEIVERLDVLTKAIYELSAVGCCLHIVLDDGNWQPENIIWCWDRAKHGVCREVAELLWLLTDEQRELALGEGFINYHSLVVTKSEQK